MGAALALGSVRSALTGAAANKLSSVDRTALIVRAGRVAYAGSAVYVVGLWYFGWRNQRVAPGSYKFPIPGRDKTEVRFPKGAADADDAADFAPNLPVLSDTIAGSQHAKPRSPSPQIGGGQAAQLVYIGHVAQAAFHLRVGEHPAFGGVHPVHAKGSWHYKNRAIDVSGDARQMALFANWVADNYGSQLLELFWNGIRPRNVKNGHPVSPNFVPGHRDHVHVAM